MDDEPRYWYAAPYSWGYRPAIIGPYVRQDAHPFKSLGLFFGLLALMLAVHRWKGEPVSRD